MWSLCSSSGRFWFWVLQRSFWIFFIRSWFFVRCSCSWVFQLGFWTFLTCWLILDRIFRETNTFLPTCTFHAACHQRNWVRCFFIGSGWHGCRRRSFTMCTHSRFWVCRWRIGYRLLWLIRGLRSHWSILISPWCWTRRSGCWAVPRANTMGFIIIFWCLKSCGSRCWTWGSSPSKLGAS